MELTTRKYYPRAKNVTHVTLTLENEALVFLKQRAPHGKRLGGYLSRLIYEDVARHEERAKLSKTLVGRAAAAQGDVDSSG